MNTRLITMAFAAAMIVACAEKNAELETLKDAPVFDAVTESFGDTKTSLDGNNRVMWTKEDEIAVFQGFSIADEYHVTESSAETGTASFTLASDNSNKNNSDFVSGIEIPSNVAYYPYSETITCVNREPGKYELGVSLPAVQTYAPDSFGSGAFPMAAATTSVADHTLRFMNVSGAIKLQLMGDVTVKSIMIQGNNGEKLSGAATVHTYVDGTAPAVNMAETAGAAVTLDCGEGVVLQEGVATSFIIALPPVLFSAGFTLTVTDTEEKVTTVKTDRTNTVLRSSILVMPPFKLGEVPSDPDQDDEIPVSTVKINEAGSHLVFAPGGQFTFTAALTPVDVPAEYLTWTSSDASVATIDPSTGVMTAIGGGTATITAEAGGVKATANLEVLVTTAVPTADYIDEYGINHGKGIAIMETVWAPVNCGYHATNYPYGKLYQWGRKYGQGYSTTYDAAEPTLSAGPVSRKSGESADNANVFYKVSDSPYDWLAPQEDDLWNSGSEAVPVKTQYDPCPDGWRVPTYAELCALNDNWLYNHTNAAGQKGTKLYGRYRQQDDAPSVFLPYAGYRDNYASPYYREKYSYYWSSKANSLSIHSMGSYALHLSNSASVFTEKRGCGYSVRCVQE